MRRVIPTGEIPTSDEMLGWIHTLGEIGERPPGSDGGRRAEELLERWFRDLGLQGVAREAIPLEAWEPEECRLECGELSIPGFPVSRSRFTGREGLRGPLVWLGQGDPESLAGRSLAGKIAVVEVPFAARPYQLLRKTAHAVHDPGGTFAREAHTRATWILPTFARAYSWCAARGAAGFVGILRDLRANRYRYHYRSSRAEETLPIPAIFLGRDDGARLEKVLRAAPADGTLIAEGKTRPAVAHNVVGYLPGASDETVLVTSHHDSPFRGAVDDATGIAQILAAARYFSRRRPAERPLSLVFLASTANYLDSLGARSFLARHAHDLAPRLVLAVATEHVGKEAEERDGKLVPTGLVEPRGIFVSDRPELLDLSTLAVLGNDLRRTFIVPVAEGGRVDGEAGPYLAAGIPSIAFVSGPEYILTDDNGPEWVAAEELVPTAKTLIEIIEAFISLSME